MLRGSAWCVIVCADFQMFRLWPFITVFQDQYWECAGRRSLMQCWFHIQLQATSIPWCTLPKSSFPMASSSFSSPPSTLTLSPSHQHALFASWYGCRVVIHPWRSPRAGSPDRPFQIGVFCREHDATFSS